MAGVNLPSGFGGIVRYQQEYSSKFNLKPVHIIVFVIFIIAFRIGLQLLVK